MYSLGSQTNFFAIFFLSNSHLKNNVQQIYVIGGSTRSENPIGCYPENDNFNNEKWGEDTAFCG